MLCKAVRRLIRNAIGKGSTIVRKEYSTVVSSSIDDNDDNDVIRHYKKTDKTMKCKWRRYAGKRWRDCRDSVEGETRQEREREGGERERRSHSGCVLAYNASVTLPIWYWISVPPPYTVIIIIIIITIVTITFTGRSSIIMECAWWSSDYCCDCCCDYDYYDYYYER